MLASKLSLQIFNRGHDRMREEFWKHYALSELNTKEWEALCDGCGQCCLVRHVSEHEVSVFTIACELLDIEHSRCSDYHNRLEINRCDNESNLLRLCIVLHNAQSLLLDCFHQNNKHTS